MEFPRYHFILDFETIGQDAQRVPVIDCSYFVFDWERFTKKPYEMEELIENIRKDKLDIKHQVTELGYAYTKEDIDFWTNQGHAAMQMIKPNPKLDIKVEEFIDNVITYINKAPNFKFWWSRSNTFDPIILERLARSVGREKEIRTALLYWAVRDTRTWIDAKFNFSQKNGFVPVKNEAYWNGMFQLHNSSHDVAADIMRLQTIARAEEDLEQL